MMNLMKNIRVGSSWRSLSAVGYDFFAAVVAYYLAFLLRFNFDIPDSFAHTIAVTIGVVVLVQMLCFIGNGLYIGVWRFASIPDLKRILLAIGSSTAILFALLLLFRPHGVVPRSVLMLDPMLLLILVGGGRLLYRAWKDRKLYAALRVGGQPVLLIGSGNHSIALIKELSRSTHWRVVGILDQDPSMHGRQIFGVNVLGGLTDIESVIQSSDIKQVILALPDHLQSEKRLIVTRARELGLKVLTIPSIDDLMAGHVTVSTIRPVDVEDLLGRDKVALDISGLQALISNHVVLVSGAAGSIGSELCRQLIKFHPQLLVCLDHSELGLYRLEQSFTDTGFKEARYIVSDVRQEQRMTTIFERYQPTLVLHAAAYKHVPLMENENVFEALHNNVLGTYQLAMLCQRFKVPKFVLVSTDKAVNPTNVMGASKRLAEMVCQSLQGKTGTQYAIVRFGNVLGSSGSVIPKFREQIAKGGPVTVTHPEVTRFFMSIPEAAQLVLQASLMANGGEIYVLDMGTPVRIVDLAKDMIKLSGLDEDEIEIEYTGLRPGEKLYEELLADDELTLPTHHEKIRVATARAVDMQWTQSLLAWMDGIAHADETRIKQELKLWVEDYVADTRQPQSDPLTTRGHISSTLH